MGNWETGRCLRCGEKGQSGHDLLCLKVWESEAAEELSRHPTHDGDLQALAQLESSGSIGPPKELGILRNLLHGLLCHSAEASKGVGSQRQEIDALRGANFGGIGGLAGFSFGQGGAWVWVGMSEG